MSAHSLLRDIMMMLGGAVCVGLPMAVAIIWLCSWLPPTEAAFRHGRLNVRCEGLRVVPGNCVTK
jgi:hypothetical protein